jgi:imidazolonepropionase-like amidohydrolase
MWVPTLLRNEATMAGLGRESSGRRLFMEGLEQVRGLLPLAIEAGVEVLAGTDLAGAPADVAAEALRLIDYGLTAAQAVAAASTSGLRATNRDHVFAPGAPASAVLFAADPTSEPAVLAHPHAVIRLGRLL